MHQSHANTATLTGCHVMVERNSPGQRSPLPGQPAGGGSADPGAGPGPSRSRRAALPERPPEVPVTARSARGRAGSGGSAPPPVPALPRGRGTSGLARGGGDPLARRGTAPTSPQRRTSPPCPGAASGAARGRPPPSRHRPRPHRSVRRQPPLPAGETSSPSLSSPESESMLQVPAGEAGPRGRSGRAACGWPPPAGGECREPGRGSRERAASGAWCLLLSSQPGRWVRATTCSHLA